jgi:hypothetical protein
VPNIEPRPLSPGEIADLERRRQEYAQHQQKALKRGSDGKGTHFRPAATRGAFPWSVKG